MTFIVIAVTITDNDTRSSARIDNFTECLKDSGSMLEDEHCYITEKERLEAEQEVLMKQLSTRLKQPGPPGANCPNAAAALAKAQEAWVTYKNADCEIIDDVFGLGNASDLAGESCAIDHYTIRNAILRNLLKKYLSNGQHDVI